MKIWFLSCSKTWDPHTTGKSWSKQPTGVKWSRRSGRLVSGKWWWWRRPRCQPSEEILPFTAQRFCLPSLKLTAKASENWSKRKTWKPFLLATGCCHGRCIKKWKNSPCFYKSRVFFFFSFVKVSIPQFNAVLFWIPSWTKRGTKQRCHVLEEVLPRFFRWWSGRKLPSGGFANFYALVTDDPNKTMRCISLCIPFQCGKIDLEMIYFNCHLHILQCCGKELGFLSGSGFPGRVCIWSTGQNMWRMPGIVLCPTQIFCRRLVPKSFRLNPKDWRFERLRETFSQRLEL